MCKKHDTKNVLLFLGPKGPLTLGGTRQKKICDLQKFALQQNRRKNEWQKAYFYTKWSIFGKVFSVHVTYL